MYWRDQVADTIAKNEAEDGHPRWHCFGDPGVTWPGDVSLGLIPSWVPGVLSQHFQQGTGSYINEDMIMVIQVNYNTSGGTGPDQTDVHLQMADPDADMMPLTGVELISPVEIPWPQELNEEACTREAAKQVPTA